MGKEDRDKVETNGGDQKKGPPRLRILEDRPEAENMKGDGHKRLAETIYDIVSQQEGGRALALEGPWGSGKSSIIDALRNRCKPKDQSKPTEKLVYVFDAWKHEHDSLRLAFLSGLAKAMTAAGWVDETKSEGHTLSYDEMRGKVRTETRDDRGIFSALDLILLSMLVLGGSLLALDAEHSLGSIDGLTAFFSGSWVNWLIVVPVLFVLATILTRTIAGLVTLTKERKWWSILTASVSLAVFLGLAGPVTYVAWASPENYAWKGLTCLVWFIAVLYSARLFRRREKPKWLIDIPPWSTWDRYLNRPSFFESFLRKKPQVSSIHIKGERPVTSEEFEERFLALLEDAFGAGPNESGHHPERRLIVVIDNLDRLETDHAKAMWTSLRTFLEPPLLSTPEQERAIDRSMQVWFIVPYDRSQLSTLWKSGMSEAKPGAAIGPDRANGYLDKAFALRLDVPPLHVAGWKGVLRGYLKDAFDGSVRLGEMRRIVDVVADLAVWHGRSPTHRELKLFVNDLVSLVLLHQAVLAKPVGLVPQSASRLQLVHLAAYQAVRRLLPGQSEIVQWLRRDLEIGENEPFDRYRHDPHAIKLACLVFNVHSEQDAMELLMLPRILEVLPMTEVNELVQYMDLEAFWHVLDKFAKRIWDEQVWDGTQRVNAAINLAALRENSPPQRAHFVQPLVDLIATDPFTAPHAEDGPKRYHSVLAARPSAHPLRTMLARLNLNEALRFDSDTAPPLAKSIIVSWRYVTENQLVDAMPDTLRAPDDPSALKTFLATLDECKADRQSLFRRIRIRQGLDLNPVVPLDPSASELDLNAIAAIGVLQESGQHEAFARGKLQDCDKLYRDGVQRKPASIAALRRLLLRVKAPSLPEVWIQRGADHHHLLTAMNTHTWDLAAELIVEIGSYQSLTQPVKDLGRAINAYKDLQQAESHINQREPLIKALCARPAHDLARLIDKQVETDSFPATVAAILSGLESDKLYYVVEAINFTQLLTAPSFIEQMPSETIEAIIDLGWQNPGPRWDETQALALSSDLHPKVADAFRQVQYMHEDDAIEDFPAGPYD